MSLLVANSIPRVWTLIAMTRQQMAQEFPDLRRFFDCGFDLDPKNHADGVVGLVSPMQALRINLENGEFE